jgi:hypothetical protein
MACVAVERTWPKESRTEEAPRGNIPADADNSSLTFESVRNNDPVDQRDEMGRHEYSMPRSCGLHSKNYYLNSSHPEQMPPALL